MDRARTGSRRRVESTFRRTISAAVALLAVVFLVAPPATALALPTPKDYTAYLDLECFATDPYQPPATTLTLRHLNPVLANLPVETVTLGTREQLCTPVAKNRVYPPNGVADFIKFTDLACYKISGATVNRALVLSQLNPLLANLPRQQVTLTNAQQLCVPVLKNNVGPVTREVLEFISHIDLKCYGITPNNPLNQGLNLTQLNPVIARAIQPRDVRVVNARQLCVPVQKRGDEIPPEILRVVQWIDLEKYDVVSASAVPSVSLTLQHVNPVLRGLPVERATLLGRSQLALPVAKNGSFPPG
ncbi:hypothetical protein [Spongiactinospora sp. TRM90649]|uniref:hypothetical protein n=1 Tax=Spongiactinospora sp. TRM90649 TaxID=3031114 RepID=UPI0023F96665|nr:hypothetical protein [Spongiactinospora sp. TRM90649]MDF5754389.1 hypothetical protein [Spongiactinospora sp. TRM90649]